MEGKVNILISSVGGQGGLSLSRMLAEASGISGYSVSTGEILGMAQRFGSVVSFVRIGIGTKVYSPIFSKGEADYLLCLEIIECARNIGYLKKTGSVITSLEAKPPVSASMEGKKKAAPASQYIDYIAAKAPRAIFIDHLKVKEAAGTLRSMNAAVLGAFTYTSKIFDDSAVLEAMRKVLRSQRAYESSEKAYLYGKTVARDSSAV